MNDYVLAGDGDFFTQDYWGEAFGHVACVDAGDLPLPEGDPNPFYCPDPAQKGKFKIEGYIQSEPGAAGTTLQMPLSVVANYLLEAPCPFNGWVTYNCSGTRGNPDNFQLAALLFNMRRSNSSILAQAVAREPSQEARIMTSAELAYESRLLFYNLVFTVQSLDNTASANAIAFLPQACGDRCTSERGLCKEGYLALDGAIYNSEVKYTKNGGGTWNPCPSDPFTYAGGDASDVVVVQTATGHRAIVARGSVTAGEPAEVAITTDWGATWMNVDVGAVLGQVINRLFLYSGKIWAVCSGGYIYRSDDLGNTWITLEAGVEDLNDICMYSLSEGYAVGDANVYLYTLDGNDWVAGTGPIPGTDLLSIAVNGKEHVFVGAADGNLYRSENYLGAWFMKDGLTPGAWCAFSAGSIDRIRFDEGLRYVGGLVWNNAAGVGYAFRSHDGGATWQLLGGQTGAWNAGINDVHICDQNAFFVAGEAFGGETFVAKATQTTVTA